MEQRPALASDNPTASAGDLQRLLVDGWRKLDDLDKSVYEAQHEVGDCLGRPQRHHAALGVG